LNLYILEPEVAGGHGENTIYGTNSEASISISNKVKFLHYEFDGWLGDDLIESTPCFIVTTFLVEKLVNNQITDFEIDECLVSTSEQFRDIYPDKALPIFKRLIPKGSIEVENDKYKNWSGHHICISQIGDLVVTEKILDILKQCLIEHCDINLLKKIN